MTLATPAVQAQADALFERAVKHHLAGQQAEALRVYRQVLAAQPSHAAAHNNLATILADVGQVAEAEQLLARAVALQPDYGEAHNNAGLLCIQRQDFVAACAAFERACACDTGNADWHNNWGNALFECFRFQDALTAYTRALLLAPGNADAWSNRGLALRGLREPEQAIASFERALELAPDHLNAISNLGVVLKEQRQFPQAIAVLERGLRAHPTSTALHTNLASVYERLGDAAQVRAWANRARELDPDYAESYNLLANMEMEDGRFGEAESLYEKVRALEPENRNANWNLALIWLLRGDFERGWPQFEWRKRLQSVLFDHGTYGYEEWRGESLIGKTILLHTEQGIGDAIQFIRFAATLKQRGAARVIVESPHPIVPLLTGVPGVDHVIARGQPHPPYDFHANLMSLPGALGTTLNSIPAEVPYIPVEPRPVTSVITAPRGKIKVGFVWAGNPGHARDFLRSAPLSSFLELASDERFAFFSLQKGSAAEAELVSFGRSDIIDLAPNLSDFRDTAAAINALDLVITVDTSVAHLAGALGKPTWVLLPKVPDFRWMLDRDDSPWYPTMRLFRQSEARSWDSVFVALHDALKTFVAADAERRSGENSGEMVTIKSARLTPDGRPRFDLWVPLAALADPSWFRAYEDELVGAGFELPLRAFIHEFAKPESTLVDIEPGVGLATVDAATLPNAPRSIVIVDANPANATRLQGVIARRSPHCNVTARTTLGDETVPNAIVRIGGTSPAAHLTMLTETDGPRPLAVLIGEARPSDIGLALTSAKEHGYIPLALGAVDGEATLSTITDDEVQALAILRNDVLNALESGEAAPLDLGIDWELRNDTGWGIYGLNLTLALTQQPKVRPSILTADPACMTPMTRHALRDVLARPIGASVNAFPGVMLRALGNNLSHAPSWETVRAGRNVGVIFFEDTHLDESAKARARALDLIVAGSSWNEQVLRANGVTNVTTVLQGIDPTVFHPAARSGQFGDRFVIFSGGKLEFRKGQDIVLAAFRIFNQRHPDSILVTAWHNNWPHLIVDLDRAGHTVGTPAVQHGRMDIAGWATRNGVPQSAVVDLGPQPNAVMGQFVREATVALFPNRAEGGTNLVAMECMACGVPTILSANTGHLDLIATGGCIPLHSQSEVPTPSQFYRATEGWGESSVDEIVECLERAYTNRDHVAQIAQTGARVLSGMTWAQQTNKLLEAIATVL